MSDKINIDNPFKPKSFLDNFVDKKLKEVSDGTTLGDVTAYLKEVRDKIDLLIRTVAPTDTFTDTVQIGVVATPATGNSTNNQVIAPKDQYTVAVQFLQLSSINAVPTNTTYQFTARDGTKSLTYRTLPIAGQYMAVEPDTPLYFNPRFLLQDGEGLYVNIGGGLTTTGIIICAIGLYIKTLDIKSGLVK